MDSLSKRRIRIEEKGPFIVEGGIPLYSESIHSEDDKVYSWVKRKEWKDLPETYRLCRCGKSKRMPFCDGSHTHEKFNHEEAMTRDTFEERAMVRKGKGIHLADDIDLCSWSRFCHTPAGKTWTLLDKADDPEIYALLLKSIQECPSGRLVAIDPETGEALEPDLPMEIVVSQDPEKTCSGPLILRGGIPVEAPDGYVYEVRNRATLCRCGHSHNAPFCDSRHSTLYFDDGSIYGNPEDQ